jgi:hypothetical protein
MKAECNLLFAAVHQSSATIDFPVNDPASTMLYSLSALTGAYGDATAAGDASAAAINRCAFCLIAARGHEKERSSISYRGCARTS